MTDTGPGPFIGISLEDQTAQCLAWLTSGRRPDEHVAVRPPSEKLPEDFEPMAPVSVQRDWAVQTYIHCNACNKRGKFRDNGHVATSGNGWWYIVGPDCSGPEHTARLHQRINTMHRRDFLRGAESDVRAFAAELPAWLRFIQTLKEPVAVADRGHRFISTKRAKLHAHLDSARRNDSQLAVLTTVQQPNRWGGMEAQDVFVPFARVRGLGSIAKPCEATRQFKSAESVLSLFADEHALDNATAEAVTRGKQAELNKQLQTAVSATRDCHKAVLDARAFWADANLATIASWAIRADSRYEMEFPYTRRGNDLRLVSEDGEVWDLQGIDRLLTYSATPPEN